MSRIILITICFFLFGSKVLCAKEIQYNFCNNHKFTFLLLDVYDVKLCTLQKQKLRPETIYNENFSLVINYNMNFDKNELAKSSIKEINRYYDLESQEKNKFFDKLVLIFPDVKKGDVIEANYNKDGHTSFYHNKNYRGSIDNERFSQIFLDIWLHKDNKYQKMVKNLFQINE